MAKHIRTVLKELRRQKNLSRRKLSALTGVKEAHILRIESLGYTDIYYDSLVALAAFLGVTAEEILFLK